ncbi:unnamed protein product [Caenorhabditis nigoni]
MSAHVYATYLLILESREFESLEDLGISLYTRASTWCQEKYVKAAADFRKFQLETGWITTTTMSNLDYINSIYEEPPEDFYDQPWNRKKTTTTTTPAPPRTCAVCRGGNYRRRQDLMHSTIYRHEDYWDNTDCDRGKIRVMLCPTTCAYIFIYRLGEDKIIDSVMMDCSHQLIHRSKDIPLSKPRFSWNYLEFLETVKYEVIRDGFNITYYFEIASSPSVSVILDNLEGKFAHILEEREMEKRNRAVHIVLIMIVVFLVWHTTIWFCCVWYRVCKGNRYRKRLRRRIEREEENNRNIIALLEMDQQSSGTAYRSTNSVDYDDVV